MLQAGLRQGGKQHRVGMEKVKESIRANLVRTFRKNRTRQSIQGGEGNKVRKTAKIERPSLGKKICSGETKKVKKPGLSSLKGRQPEECFVCRREFVFSSPGGKRSGLLLREYKERGGSKENGILGSVRKSPKMADKGCKTVPPREL